MCIDHPLPWRLTLLYALEYSCMLVLNCQLTRSDYALDARYIVDDHDGKNVIESAELVDNLRESLATSMRHVSFARLLEAR